MTSYLVYKHALDYDQNQPRDNDGKWAANGNSAQTGVLSPSEKKASVKIDFTKDNVLPKLNPETIATLGPEADKPVRLKQTTIQRNQDQHHEVPEGEYNSALGEALYSPELVGRADIDKPYYNLIGRVGPKKSSVVILELKCDAAHCDIVHVHYLRDKSRRTLERKMKNIKEKTSN